MPPFLRLLPLPRQLTSDVPKPVAAYVGFLLSLPRLAVTLPQQAIGVGVSLAARYEELAELGASVLGGRPVDAEEDIDEPLPSYATMDTSAWGAADTDANIVRLFEADGAETAAERETEALDATAQEPIDVEAQEAAPVDDTTAEDAAADATLDAVTTTPPAQEPPVGEAQAEEVTAASPEAAEPSPVPEVIRKDTGAAAEFLAAAIEDRSEPPASRPERADLPVEGYDGLSAAALRSRVSGLSAADLRVLRDYEAGHAKRVTVLSMLERAIAKA